LICGRGPSEAHHSNFNKGMGQRGHDHTSVPLCHKDHMDFHNVAGHFKGWVKRTRKDWQITFSMELLCRYLKTQSSLGQPEPLPPDTADIF
jgi:hypothetical protein